MFNSDIFFKGFLAGFGMNAAMTLIIWLIVDVIGFSPIEIEGKLYFLAVVPAVFLMRACMRKRGLVKMGSGVLISIILFIALFFIALHKNWI